MRILAVDPGSKQVGLAISDPTGTIATALPTLSATPADTLPERIASAAAGHSAERIIIPDSTTLTDYLLNKTATLIETMIVYPERMRANIESTRWRTEAAGWLEQSSEHPDGRGLAGSIRPQKGENLAFGYIERDVVDGDMIGVSFGQSFDFDHIYNSGRARKLFVSVDHHDRVPGSNVSILSRQ